MTNFRGAYAAVTDKWEARNFRTAKIMKQSFVLQSGDRKMLGRIVFALSMSLVCSMASSAMEMLRHKDVTDNTEVKLMSQLA